MVVLDKYPAQSILTVMLDAITEFIEEREATIDVASSPTLIGLADDLVRGLRRLYPGIDTYITIKNIRGYHESSFHISPKRKDIEPYALRINIDGRKKSSRVEAQYSIENTILSCKDVEFSSKISVNAKGLEWKDGSFLMEKLSKYMPKEKRFGLYFNYANPSPFVIKMLYQNLPQLKVIPTEHKILTLISCF